MRAGTQSKGNESRGYATASGIGAKTGCRMRASRGYTFTIAIILISMAIISLAAFSSEWRKGQEASYANLAPAFESARTQGWVASDLGSVIGENADIEKNGSHVLVQVHARLPFRKEGLAIADLSNFSSQLSRRTAGSIPYAVTVTPPRLEFRQSPHVVVLPDGGNISYANNGSNGTDLIAYTHPYGWNPSAVSVSIYCNKDNATISALSASGSGGTPVSYAVSYSDRDVSLQNSSVSGYATGTAYYSVSFADGSLLNFTSDFASNGANRTNLTYTKSPGAYLVLTFDRNYTYGTGTVLDYSPYQNNFTIVYGAIPVWQERNCASGGCYEFNGSTSSISGGNLNFSDAAAATEQPDDLLNGSDGTLNDIPSPSCGDASNDDWTSWTETQETASVYFDCLDNGGGDYAMGAYYDGNTQLSTTEFSQQTILADGTRPHTLSFFAKGDGVDVSEGWYFVRSISGRYLQYDGSWSGTAIYLSTGALTTDWQQVSRTFLPESGDTNPTIGFRPYNDTTNCGQFITCPAGTFYVENATLLDATGLNGGFEYFADSGQQDQFVNWNITGTDIFDAVADPHTGTYGMQISGANPGSYISSNMPILRNGTKHALEFWSKSDTGTSPVQYSVYDTVNTLFLQSDGSWGISEQLFDSSTDRSYVKTTKKFTTGASNTGAFELRFYSPADASNGYLDSLSLGEIYDFSVLAWVRAYRNGTSDQPSLLYQYNPATGGYSGMDWYMESGTSNLVLGFFSSTESILPNVSIADGSWHLAGIAVNQTGKYIVYLDGAQVYTADFSLGSMGTNSTFIAGGKGAGTSSANASLDDVRIYRRVLSAAEMGEHYRGIYQDRCYANFTFAYSASSLQNRSLSANYNAKMKIRAQDPYTLLSYQFDDDNVGNTGEVPYQGAVTDSSPSALHGTFGGTSGGIAWYDFDSAGTGGSIAFAAAGKYIRTQNGTLNMGSNNFTLSFWLHGKPNTNGTVLAKDSWAGSNNGFLVFNNGSSWYYWDGSAATLLGAATNSWTHYAITREGLSTGNIRVYLNGTNTINATDTRNLQNDLPFTIGATSAQTPTNFLSNVYLDDVRILNRSISASDALSLYGNLDILYAGPIYTSKD